MARVFAVLATLLACAVLPAAASAGSPDGIVSPRIVGGSTTTDPTAVPWQVQLVTRIDPTHISLCGGTLVALNRVVTAAHCVRRPNGTLYDLTAFRVYAGQTSFPATGTFKAVDKVAVHPGFDDVYTDAIPDDFAYDAAVLALTTSFTASASVTTIPLAPSGTGLALDTPLLVSGWGTTEQRNALDEPVDGTEDSPSPVLKQAVVKVKSCSGVGNASIQVCASDTGTDACHGDSGGPLVTTTAPTTLVGIVSAGSGCAWSTPGIYTRVAEPTINAFLTEPFGAVQLVSRPAVGGQPIVGATLTCSPGTWTGAPALAARFLLDGAAVTEFGATSYAPTQGDVGRSVTCEVQATGDGQTKSAVSDPLGPITMPAVVTPPPSDTGTPPAQPNTTPPGVTPVVDVTAPTATIRKLSCRKRKCTVDLALVDGGSGVKTLEATATTKYRTTCRKAGKKRRCTKTVHKTLTVVRRAAGLYRVTTPKLRLGVTTFRLVATDVAGNRRTSSFSRRIKS